MKEQRDVVIIGSGAGGSPLAFQLSRAGFDVLVLEKGARHTRGDYRHDEIRMAYQRDFFLPRLEDDPHVLVDSDSASPEPRRTTVGWIASCVGGGTEHMGGSFFRLHPEDFRIRSRFGAYEAVEDWPYEYTDLEPYYDLAEWEVGVSGSAGANPFEGPRSRPYPMPPLESHPFADLFDEACRALGLHPFPTPRATNSRPYRGRPACSYCDFCATYGCPTGARGSAQEALLSRAERTGRCEIRPRAMVREITVGPDGRATGCIYIDATGVEHHVGASIVCVCCSAIESARLLLLSRSPLFPDGLANGTGLVGRNLQFGAGSFGHARFRYDRHPEKALESRHPFLLRSIMDFYFLPPGVSDFPKGGLHRFDFERPNPIATAQRIATSSSNHILWGRALKNRLREHFLEGREVSFEVFQDFIPNDRTFVELDPDVVDRWGLPVARIHVHRPEHHARAGRWLLERGFEILDALGADALGIDSVGHVNDALVHGTCRAGKDPARSVLNQFCQAHEVPNLFVVDGSFMPTSGGVPSTLTIIANAFRTADYIIDRARSGDLR